MKDEEMAEEYAKKEVPFDTTESGEKLYTEYDLEQAFLAGLKAGRPQWHDLRKDKNDLPKLDKTDMSNYVITDKGVAYYNGRVKSWYIQNEYILSDDVIAWCEIPTFDKESEIKREIFPEITLPEESAEFVDKIIADAEKRLKEIE